MSIRDQVQRALDGVAIPSSHGGYAGGDDFTPEYITYSVELSRPDDHADNRPLSVRHQVDVNYFYASDPDIVPQQRRDARMDEILSAMRAAGFGVINAGTDIFADPGARLYGIAFEFSVRRFGE